MSSEETLNFLVGYMRQARDVDNIKPIFWLGAGCSVYDGVPLNEELITSTLANYGVPAGWGSPQFQFDQLLEKMPPDFRVEALKRYFRRDIRDDSPYHGLVRILQAGYADMVFTFNTDDLLQKAFEAAGLREPSNYTLIDLASLRVDPAIQRIRSLGGPRIKIVKLHGDYGSGFNYMTSSEIVSYEPEIKRLVDQYSSRCAIVCGYSFFHLNVLNAFSISGDPLFYVNKEFPSLPMVLSLMSSRSRFQKPLVIDEPLGCFEVFIRELEQRLGI